MLQEANRPARAAWFLSAGIASVVKNQGRVARTEICLIGCEGFVGAPLLLADGCWPYETFVQTETLTALRIDAAPFVALLDEVSGFRPLLLRAVLAQLVQLGEGLVSAVWQKVPARLARWLLMYRDRMASDRLEITHEFIAAMIGVQRTGITAALHDLEGRGFIHGGRGVVTVRDVAGLEHLADGTYGTTEGEQRRLLHGYAARPR